MRWAAIIWIALWTIMACLADNTGLLTLVSVTLLWVGSNWSYYAEWLNNLKQEVI